MSGFQPVITRPHLMDPNGEQRLYAFENGYGASVVRFYGSYGAQEGLYELAVIWYDPEKDGDYSVVYDTPVTDDVIGHLTESDVQGVLAQIAALPEKRGS